MNINIYETTKNLGLNKKEVDNILKNSYKTSGSNRSSDIYKAGTRYGTISPKDAYKAGTYYGSISTRDF